MARVEKNCRRHTSPRERRSLKRRTVRLVRQAAHRDPENAPEKLRHVTRGWSD